MENWVETGVWYAFLLRTLLRADDHKNTTLEGFGKP